MRTANPSRAAVLAFLSFAAAASGCGRNWQSIDGGWVQIGDSALLRGGVENPPEGWRSGYSIVRESGRPARLLHAWIARQGSAVATTTTSGQGFHIQFDGNHGEFDENVSWQANEMRFQGKLAWDASRSQLVESLDVDGVRADLAAGRVFVVDWRDGARRTQLAIDLPAPTEQELQGSESEVTQRLATKYLELLRAHPKVVAFLDGK